MALFGSSSRTANIVFDDYIVRMIENNGKDLNSVRNIKEKYLPEKIIENGRIVDEPAFFNFMKNAVQEWGIKNRQARFFVPQSLVILREIEIPNDVKKDDIKGYINIEVGNTIHFPFKNPIIDIYPRQNESNKVTVLAAPESELLKYTELLSDIMLKPTVAEIQPLGIYRYFLHTSNDIDAHKAYMLIEYNISSVNISIFHQHRLEFLRHQPLHSLKEFWEVNLEGNTFTFTGDESRLQGEIDDQLNEIDRIMNFYRFSLHQGEKEVNEFVIVGDTPHLERIVSQMSERFPITVTLLDVKEQLDGETISRAFIPALGLGLRGGK